MVYLLKMVDLSMAMLVYQRVIIIYYHMKMYHLYPIEAYPIDQWS